MSILSPSVSENLLLQPFLRQSLSSSGFSGGLGLLWVYTHLIGSESVNEVALRFLWQFISHFLLLSQPWRGFG